MKNNQFRKRMVGIFFIIGVTLFSSTVLAQNQIIFESLRIQFWPEYDRPEMLVIAQIQLQEDVLLPTTIRVELPVGVSDPNAVAIINSENVLEDANYQIIEDGARRYVLVNSNSLFIQVEYYDSAIILDNQTRNYQYLWRGDYQIDDFLVDIIPPADGEILSLSPLSISPISSEQGFKYFQAHQSGIELGEEIKLKLVYTRPTSSFGVAILNIDEPETKPESVIINQWLFWIIGVLIAVLIFLGGKQFGNKVKKSNLQKISTKIGKYCKNCGKEPKNLDNYCRSCGEPL